MRECETGLNVRSEDAGDLGEVSSTSVKGKKDKQEETGDKDTIPDRADADEAGVHDAMDGGGGPPRAERKQLAPARPTLQSRLEGAKTRHPLSSAHHSDGMGLPSTLG